MVCSMLTHPFFHALGTMATGRIGEPVAPCILICVSSFQSFVCLFSWPGSAGGGSRRGVLKSTREHRFQRLGVGGTRTRLFRSQAASPPPYLAAPAARLLSFDPPRA